MAVLASAASTTISLILLWGVVIPGFAGVAVMYAYYSAQNERAEDEAYLKGERPADDPDRLVS